MGGSGFCVVIRRGYCKSSGIGVIFFLRKSTCYDFLILSLRGGCHSRCCRLSEEPHQSLYFPCSRFKTRWRGYPREWIFIEKPAQASTFAIFLKKTRVRLCTRVLGVIALRTPVE